MNTVLVTGGCGFIGTNFIKLALTQCPDWQIVILDALTFALPSAFRLHKSLF